MHATDTRVILLGLLALMVLYVIGVAVLVTSGLFVATFLARHDVPDNLQALAFDRVRPPWSQRIVGQLVEVLVAAFDLVLRFLYILRLLPKLRDPGTGTPIVMLPGYTENAGAMWWFARKLAKRGFRPVLLDFPSTFHRLESNVAWLAQRLALLRESTGYDKVAIVAHSMGGVIARAHMLTSSDHGVLTLVAIASPFRGTHLAKLGAAFRLGHSAVDMCPNSAFACRYPPEARTSAPIHTIVGCQENIVSPVWSCVLPGCDTHVLSLPVGHDAPLHLEESYLRMEQWLVEDGVQPARELEGSLRAAGDHVAHDLEQ
ncbi:MAG TPA: alpha/beta fold hydrolase [Polyangiales bacterium]|nr:alpha/beta fold hydrolase [Polyangiales bacterium]